MTARWQATGGLIALLLPVLGSPAVGEPRRGAGPTPPARARYTDPALPVEDRVEDLLGQMTLPEKIGQMTQGEQQTVTPARAGELLLGGMLSGGDSAPVPNTIAAWTRLIDSYQSAARSTRLGIPILYGVDAVHGRQLVSGATVFPHLLGLAATGDEALLGRVGEVTAREMAATGVFWTFSPMVAVTQDERWGRTYESFGEDTRTVTRLAVAYVTGMMAALGPGLPRPLPTAKHFIGDGATMYGSSQTRHFLLDEGDARGESERMLATLLPPYRGLLEAGTGCVMASFNRWNGVRMHAHAGLLTGILKGQLGFQGFVVSDWEGFRVLDGTRHQQIVSEVNAGVDMTMAPLSVEDFGVELADAVARGEVTRARVDDAVRRILRVKFSMGLFEHPGAVPALAGAFGSRAHRAVAREAVGKSLTLLKTVPGALPIHRGSTVLVAGTHANNLGLQCGGWTLHWQGVTSSAGLKGTTLLDGLREAGGATTRVLFSATGRFPGRADYGVVAVGEQPYAEGVGDRPMEQLVLSAADLATLREVRARVRRLIVVLIAGRPLVIGPELQDIDALVMAWLPGTEGEGMADALLGDRPFSGRLPIGWPMSVAGYQRADADPRLRCESLAWPRGFGLDASGAVLGAGECP